MAHILIGLDIGGTKTHAIRLEDGAVTAEAIAGSANVQNVSREAASTALAEVFSALGSDADRVIAGAGGIDTANDAVALAALISPFAPQAEIRAVHDSRLVLAAGRARRGIAVIAGTGSAVWGTDGSGNEARAGGWGYLLGDEGSGYWLGRELVRHALRRRDQGLEPDALTQALLADCSLADPVELIAHFHGPTGRRYWAQRSRLVVEAAADPVAAELLAVAAKDLARLIRQVAGRLDISGPVILGGGLGANVPQLAAGIAAALAPYGIDDVRQLDREPVYGVDLLDDPAGRAGRAGSDAPTPDCRKS
jgi:N-acetylglucosamine kinase-like BadF-type ATPase